MNVSVEQLISLQTQTSTKNAQGRLRNICILAHVDHGKTTLSDHLIGSNGLIHPKLMGEMRYMDSRDDEQARGITMKSSSISLLYVPGAAQLPNGPNSCTAEEKRDKGILVNLIDSPGHVDFCSEVSSAARLSDGALVVIDVVEGVCIQTHAVLRQAWEEKVKLTLVLNKLDRLILELQLTPEQAYERMKAIITQVNSIISAFQSERYISEADAVLASQEAIAQAAARQDEGIDKLEEEDLEFSPEKGNVVFASAHDGWAFSIRQFASMYASKMGINAEKLAGILWGDWSYDSKTKRATKIKRSQLQKTKPLFVQLALTPLWKAYKAAEPGADAIAILQKIVNGLNLTQGMYSFLGITGIWSFRADYSVALTKQVSAKMLSHPEPQKAVRHVLQVWLPLSEAVLGMAARHLPSPIQAAKERAKRLLPPRIADAQSSQLPAQVQQSLRQIQEAVQSCSTSSDAPLMVYVSKMVAVPAAAIPAHPGSPWGKLPSEEVFLGFGRVFSGQLKEGQSVHVLSAAYDPADPGSHRQEAQVTGLYMMMGRGLERLTQVQAGNVAAIRGLEAVILKSATLSSTAAAMPIAPMLFQASPIVRVAVEPANPTQMPQLVAGLRLLNRADPFVEVVVQESGEHVIGAAGEVHLEMCIKDLRERFAQIELQVSAPLVAFRESAFYPSEAPDVAPKPNKVVEGRTANGRCIIRVRAHALPRPIATALEENEALLRRILAARAQETGQQLASLHSDGNGAVDANEAKPNGREPSENGQELLRSRLESCVKESDSSMRGLLQRVWQMGPHHVGPNLLLASESRSQSPGSGGASGLFAAPQNLVVPLAKRQGIAAGIDGLSLQQHNVDHSNGSEAQQQSDQALEIKLGTSDTAVLVGFSSSGETTETAQTAEQSQPSLLSDPSLRYLQASVESGVVAGFQIAAANGPLCDEPMWGVAFEVEARLQLWGDESSASASGKLAEDVYGPMSGQVTSVARQAFRRALLEADPRLVEAMFLCEVSTTAEALSGTYAVLGQRRARVLREELREGSNLFSIHAFLPAEASFGFADDMRRRSSGVASASLMLSHWERLQVDPFFVPTTEEEREEFGEEGQGVGAPNLANLLIDKTRRRKGLPVNKKVVESSTKQRTKARKV